MSLKNLAKTIGGIAVWVLILAFVFFRLKGCTLSLWTSSKSPETYSTSSAGGRSMSIIFLPQNQTMIWYFDPNDQYIEGILTKMRGTYGTHYFWRLWQIEGPGITFGYRIYPPDTRPVNMEITVIEKYMEGQGNQTFLKKGERTHQVLLFGKDSVRFQAIWLMRETTRPEVVQDLLNKLGGSQTLK